ncbi:MAG: hypothetical protein K6F35_09505 [Lachnospiraceae bacterium]|nr:hypothetical protein [Lachnospiraceae bacterium]
MKVILLSNNNSEVLYKGLIDRGIDVIKSSDPVTVEAINSINTNLVISYKKHWLLLILYLVGKGKVMESV